MGIDSAPMQTVDRVVAILNALREGVKGVREISRELNLPKSSVHRILGALKGHGMVEQVQGADKFALGMALFELGRVVADGLDLRRRALPHLRELNARTGETVQLACLDGTDLVYLESIESQQIVRIAFSQPGTRRPATYGTLGKVLLAHVEPESRRQLIDRCPPSTGPFPNTEAFIRRLERVRLQGYAVDHDDPVEGIMGVAAPVRDHTGRVAGAIALGAPLARAAVPGREQELVDHVVAAAARISVDLGNNPGRAEGWAPAKEEV